MRPRLFVASSVEGLEVAYAIQENLEHTAEVTVWTQGVFQPSGYVLDELTTCLDEFDFGAFVFTPDDVLSIRAQEHVAVRDNVLFELGLFVGRLGRERCFIIMPRNVDNLHLPTDVLGVLPSTYEANRQDENLVASMGPAANKLRKGMEKFGRIERVPKVQAEPETDEIAYDENDVLSILEAWLGGRSRNANVQIIYLTELDHELGFPVGTSRRYIAEAGAKWGLVVERIGNRTEKFAREDDDSSLPF